MKSDMVIRPASKQDIADLYDLMRQYIVDFYERPEPIEDDVKGLINHLLDHPSSGLQFVAEEEGKLIGFATLYFTFSTLNVKKQAILNDLFVVPPARGKKVGEKLFNTSLTYIRENNFSSMTWETAKDNKAAQALYSKMGGKLADWLFYEIR